MAELGNTPGGRRGYAGTWPPRAGDWQDAFAALGTLIAFSLYAVGNVRIAILSVIGHPQG